MFCRCEFTLTEWHHANTVNDNIESHQDRWWKLPPIKQRTVESLINNPTPFLLLLLPFHLSSGLSFLITIICCLLMISKYQIHSNNFQNSLSYTHHTFIFVGCYSQNFCKIQNSFFSKSLRYPNFLKTNSLNAFSPFRRIKNSC